MVDFKGKTDGNIVSIDGDSSIWVNEKMKTKGLIRNSDQAYSRDDNKIPLVGAFLVFLVSVSILEVIV